MPGESGKVMFRTVDPEIVQQEKRVELRNLVIAECPDQSDAGSFSC
jgi:hypothetical protein